MILQAVRHVRVNNQCNDVRIKTTNQKMRPFTGTNRAADTDSSEAVQLQYRGFPPKEEVRSFRPSAAQARGQFYLFIVPFKSELFLF